MKIAVIYSGEPRTYKKTLAQHDSFFEGCNYETYHSTWTKTSWAELDLIKNSPNFKNVNQVDYNIPDRADLVRLEKLLLNNKPDHPIFMLGRIQHMTSAAVRDWDWNKWQEYDFIVRMRYDFTYWGDSFSPDQKFKSFIPNNANANDIFITRKMGGKSSPLNVWDGFAFGSPYAMSLYFDFNKWLPFSIFDSQIQSWKYQPEYVYGTYLRKVGLNVRETLVHPAHVYPDGKDVDWHRTQRTVQYYRDLANFHPEWYLQKNGKLIVENDSPTVTDNFIIEELSKEGFVCENV